MAAPSPTRTGSRGSRRAAHPVRPSRLQRRRSHRQPDPDPGAAPSRAAVADRDPSTKAAPGPARSWADPPSDGAFRARAQPVSAATSLREAHGLTARDAFGAAALLPHLISTDGA